jgi:Domain of unknown function (DUF5658)
MVRFACPRIGAAFLASALVCNVASAQEPSTASLREAARSQVVATLAPVGINAAGLGPAAQPRPGALIPLYASFATLQGLDTHSTWRALNHGAVEANPMMKGFAGNPTALLAVKAAGTAGVIFASEKMWKKNRAAAVFFMVAANSGMTWVVQNNYRAVR